MADRHSVMRIVYRAGTVPALAVFCLLVSFTSLFHYLDLKSYDILLRLSPRRPPARHVMVVGIDDPSIAALGRLPWDRKLIAQLIDRISGAGAAVIGLDLFFDVSAGAESDAALAHSLRRSGKAVLPAALISTHTSAGSQAGFSRWLRSLPEFTAAAVGHANSSPDSDGVCRRIHLSRSLNGERYWAFGLESYRRFVLPQAVVLERADSLTLGSLTIKAWRAEGYEVLIHYPGKESPVPVISASEVLSPRWNPSIVTGKVVMVGIVSSLEADQLFTPVNTAGEAMPGVLIHANVANMLIEKSLLSEASQPAILAAVAVLIGLTLLLMQWSRSPWHWFGTVAVVAATIAAACLLLWYARYVLPLPTLLFASLTSTAVFHVQRLASVRGMLQQEANRLARQLPQDPVALDAQTLAMRALQLLMRRLRWDWAELRLLAREKELVRLQLSSPAGDTPDNGFSSFVSDDYVVRVRHPSVGNAEDKHYLDIVMRALSYRLARHFDTLRVQAGSPRFKEVLAEGFDNWQLQVLRLIGSQWQADSSAARAVLECISGGIVLLDFTSHIRYWNATAGKLISFLSDAPREYDFFEILHRQGVLDREEAMRYPALLCGPGGGVDISLHCNHWQRGDLLLKCSSIHSNEGIHLGAVVAIIDMTDQKRLDAAKQEIAALVSHELRTPLTSIHGFAQQILRYSLEPERVRKVAETIVRESSRLDQMTRSYLDLSRLEQQAAQRSMAPVDLVLVARTAVEGVKAAAENKGMELRFTTREMPVTVTGQAELLERAVSNLLGNAIKYSGSGAVVQISVFSDETRAIVEVRDHGIGIPSEALPRIFDKFYRVKSAATSQVPGSGLGLAYVREVAIQHGGSVSVKSVLQEGSVFELLIPLRRAE